MTLEAQLGYFFFDKRLLKQALTTKAHALEQQQQGQPCLDQQAYSVLGDAVLKTVLVELLMRMGYQTKGDITEAKKSLESKEVLAQIAADIGIANVVRLGAGERYQQAEKNQRILAETLEALIGAIYFDGGFRATRESIKYLFRAAFPEDI